MKRGCIQAAARFVLAFATAFATAVAFAAEPEAPDWPREWFEPPKTASEIGLKSFSQSPFLDDRGLPPVEERLPDDPVVIQPYRSIGKYGGKARITLWDSWQFFNWEHALTLSADMRNVLPNLAESWSLSEDGRVTTVKLRAGLKWSDGAPLTADDFMFRLNHVFLDPDFSPVTYRLVRGCEFVKIDDLTFQYVFPEPNPMFANFSRPVRQPHAGPDALLQAVPRGVPGQGGARRAGRGRRVRVLDGHVPGPARLGERGCAQGPDGAGVQGGGAHADEDAPRAQPVTTSRSTRPDSSCHTSTRWTRSSCSRTRR